MEWQPIETAPKDGYSILVAWDELESTEIGVACWFYEQWVEGKYEACINPTHWMPLPQPPQIKS